jgi:hypothetical protein
LSLVSWSYLRYSRTWHGQTELMEGELRDVGWRLVEGLDVRPMPLGGGFVWDRRRLLLGWVPVDVAVLLAAGGVVPAEVDPAVEEQAWRGVAEGWLVRDDAGQGGADDNGFRTGAGNG